MQGANFRHLLGGPDLASSLVWQANRICPCMGSAGYADRACLICLGEGRYYLPASKPFMAGFVGQDAKNLAAMQQRMGPGMTGAAVAVLDLDAPCYDDIAPWDRIFTAEQMGTRELALIPGTKLRLPYGTIALQAFTKNDAGDAIIRVAPPLPESDGRIQVAVATTLRFQAPRGYEVMEEFGKVRSFGPGLPKRVPLKLLDVTVR